MTCKVSVFSVGLFGFFLMDAGATTSTMILLKSILDTKVREGSHSYDKSQVCNFILQLVQSCQLKLFMLKNTVLLMITTTIGICVKIDKHTEILCHWSEDIFTEADNIIRKCWLRWKITMTENG